MAENFFEEFPGYVDHRNSNQPEVKIKVIINVIYYAVSLYRMIHLPKNLAMRTYIEDNTGTWVHVDMAFLFKCST